VAIVSRVRKRVARSLAPASPPVLRRQARAWLQNATAAGHYRTLSSSEIVATRQSDTVFVFGSGSSINDISTDEWERFARHDTLSFNWFPYQTWVRIDYHLIREVATDDSREDVWRPMLLEYAELIRTNPHYSDTIFLVQKGWRAVNGNRLIGLRLLREGARVFRFTNRARHHYEPLSESFERGLVHSAMTLGDCVNFAYLMGWRSIVLVGVDMYDHRYFWLEPDEERENIDLPGRGLTVDDPFAAAESVIATFASWREICAAHGVALSVYNPRSLLSRVLPVYDHTAR
jgi:hypothetical protein